MRKTLEFLRYLKDEDIEWLKEVGGVEELRIAETLVSAGEMLDAVFILIDGRLSVTKQSEGEELQHLGPGEVVGEISAKPAPAMIVADLPSRVLRLRRADLASKCETDEGFSKRFEHVMKSLVSRRMQRALTEDDDSHEAAQDAAARQMSVELDDDTLDQIGLAARKFDWIRSSR